MPRERGGKGGHKHGKQWSGEKIERGGERGGGRANTVGNGAFCVSLQGELSQKG